MGSHNYRSSMPLATDSLCIQNPPWKEDWENNYGHPVYYRACKCISFTLQQSSELVSRRSRISRSNREHRADHHGRFRNVYFDYAQLVPEISIPGWDVFFTVLEGFVDDYPICNTIRFALTKYYSARWNIFVECMGCSCETSKAPLRGFQLDQKRAGVCCLFVRTCVKGIADILQGYECLAFLLWKFFCSLFWCIHPSIGWIFTKTSHKYQSSAPAAAASFEKADFR